MQKATRVQRLIASIIDGLIMAIVISPIIFLTSSNVNGAPTYLYTLLLNIVAIIVFFLINWKFLVNDGQTIGKKIMKIKIVKVEGSKIDQDTIIKRYGLYFVLGLVPYIGGLLSLINILLIFREDIRCGHDLFANTIVITA